MFYQLGGLQTYELVCELFEYSGERMNTGIPEIDRLQKTLDINQYSWAIKDLDGGILLDEDRSMLVLEGASINSIIPGSDNDEIQAESDLFVDFSEVDPFSEGNL